jgi:excisionase family DNA binding protein
MEDVVTNNTNLPTSLSQGALLDCAQTAHYLNLSESFIRKAVCSNTIPFVRIGTRTLFRRADLDQWINERVVPTNNKVNTSAEGISAIAMLSPRRSRKAVKI